MNLEGGLQKVLCLCFQSCCVESVASLTSTSSGGWRPFSVGRSHRKDALGSLVSNTGRGTVVEAGFLDQVRKEYSGVRDTVRDLQYLRACIHMQIHTHMEMGLQLWNPKLHRTGDSPVGRGQPPTPALINSFPQ